MDGGKTPEHRTVLITALSELATKIEADPPIVVGSDIFVHVPAGSDASAIGSSVSVTADPGGGSGTGQRIRVVAGPGQSSVIGQRITLVLGGDKAEAPPSGARSQEEIRNIVAQLRDAAEVLKTSHGSKTWIEGTLQTVREWGSSALNGAVSGVASALTAFYLSHPPS